MIKVFERETYASRSLADRKQKVVSPHHTTEPHQTLWDELFVFIALQ